MDILNELMRKNQRINLLLDATGCLLRSLPYPYDDRTLLLYTVIIRVPEMGINMPITEMITADNTSESVYNWLRQFFTRYEDDYNVTTPFYGVHKIEMDFSKAMITGAIKAFTGLSVDEYILLFWECMVNKNAANKIIFPLHICRFHAIRAIEDKLKTEYLKKKKEKEFKNMTNWLHRLLLSRNIESFQRRLIDLGIICSYECMTGAVRTRIKDLSKPTTYGFCKIANPKLGIIDPIVKQALKQEKKGKIKTTNVDSPRSSIPDDEQYHTDDEPDWGSIDDYPKTADAKLADEKSPDKEREEFKKPRKRVTYSDIKNFFFCSYFMCCNSNCELYVDSSIFDSIYSPLSTIQLVDISIVTGASSNPKDILDTLNNLTEVIEGKRYKVFAYTAIRGELVPEHLVQVLPHYVCVLIYQNKRIVFDGLKGKPYIQQKRRMKVALLAFVPQGLLSEANIYYAAAANIDTKPEHALLNFMMGVFICFLTIFAVAQSCNTRKSDAQIQGIEEDPLGDYSISPNIIRKCHYTRAESQRYKAAGVTPPGDCSNLPPGLPSIQHGFSQEFIASLQVKKRLREIAFHLTCDNKSSITWKGFMKAKEVKFLTPISRYLSVTFEVYEVALQNLKPAKQMQLSYRDLPKDFKSNYLVYYHFINNYGTDIITSTIFGGRFKVLATSDRLKKYKKDRKSADVTDKVSMENLMNQMINLDEDSFSQVTMLVEGGRFPASTNRKDIANWQELVMKEPVSLSPTLLPLHQFLEPATFIEQKRDWNR
ncbi:unnamed protein product [Orchesella dallaii]|uniref:MACPF domain-containing protein n=1 Tax=Orchesella dallaii TaxID=48710 RepID=A0ABP1R6S3_9HEXA